MKIKNFFWLLVPLAYGICPFDLLPDYIIPFAGWIDDVLLTWLFCYALFTGKLPNFLVKILKRSPFTNKYSKKNRFNKMKQGFSNYYNDNTNDNNFQDSFNGYGSNIKDDPYEILGISANASPKQIKRAYREKIHLYHPDKVSHLGDEFKSLANEKFIKVQNAYNKIISLR